MDQGSDQNVIRLLGIEDVVRLEAETAIAGNDLVGGSADARKVCQQAKRPFETGVVGFGLVAPKLASEKA